MANKENVECIVGEHDWDFQLVDYGNSQGLDGWCLRCMKRAPDHLIVNEKKKRLAADIADQTGWAES